MENEKSIRFPFAFSKLECYTVKQSVFLFQDSGRRMISAICCGQVFVPKSDSCIRPHGGKLCTESPEILMQKGGGTEVIEIKPEKRS